MCGYDVFVVKLDLSTPTDYSDEYTYNTIGNLTSKTGVGAYTYGATASSCASGTPASKPHAVAQAGSTTYAYDCNGNLTSGGGRIITWDFENRPSAISHVSGNETYSYDADGERVTKTKGSTTTYYLGGLWEEDSSGASKSYYSFNGQNIAMHQASGVTYLHGDHLGSASVTMSSAGAVAQTQEYDAWGKVRAGGITQTSINFTGQRLDASGLLYYHARMYDPVLGRFVSADSISPNPENPQTRNRYSYVLNNPLKYTDPTGHCAEDDDDIDVCKEVEASLGDLGVTVSILADWKLARLQLILKALRRLQAAAGWTGEDGDEKFENAITGGGNYKVFLQYTDKLDPFGITQGRTLTDHAAKVTIVTFSDAAFVDDDMAQITTVHEFAHAWDEASGGILSHNMAAKTGSYYGCSSYWDCYKNGDNHYVPGGSPASDYASKSHREDWAEAVAASVLPEMSRYQTFTGRSRMDNTRSEYVQGMFEAYSK